MIKYNKLPECDRLLFLDLLVSGKMNPKAPNKYLFSMITGKKYRIELIDGEYYFDETKIGYDKVNIKEEKAKIEAEKNDDYTETVIKLIGKMTNTTPIQLRDGASILFLDNDFKHSFVWNTYNGRIKYYRYKFEI